MVNMIALIFIVILDTCHEVFPKASVDAVQVP